MSVVLRPIRPDDNAPLAELIREIFREFGVARPGTVYTDPTTDDLYGLFRTPGSAYWVAEEEGSVGGGSGVFPTKGLPEGCAELVKLYLTAPYRGEGIGRRLMDRSILSARELGYRSLYLETLPELAAAVGMYERSGFTHLSAPLGESGHFGCTIWMIKDLR
ncbi:MAG: GNAT family N-acetyltransferase [Bacteroidetes bacterium]|nr:MAG: GNAT family N-acetyltransferase [Bacteroidota bacterium]